MIDWRDVDFELRRLVSRKKVLKPRVALGSGLGLCALKEFLC
jgi:hypothetical protein